MPTAAIVGAMSHAVCCQSLTLHQLHARFERTLTGSYLLRCCAVKDRCFGLCTQAFQGKAHALALDSTSQPLVVLVQGIGLVLSFIAEHVGKISKSISRLDELCPQICTDL